MKVLNLQCAAGHPFEGWFGSEDDYQSQQARGLLTCPMCGHAEVKRLPSAPRLNLSGAKAPAVSKPEQAPASASPTRPGAVKPPVPAAPITPVTPEQAQAEAVLLQAMRHVLANTEDVGRHFPEEVRRIHHGEAEHRNLRGQATPAERQALQEEGIEVFALPIPEALKGPLQ
jgi:hypothetical protein